jgi:ABC-type uncharacterized transport system ATPase subunit
MQNLCDDIIIMKEGRIIEHLHLNTLSEKGLRVILIKDNFNSREFVKNYQGTLHLTDDGFMLVENKNFALRLDNLDYHEDILPLDKLYLKLINSNTYDIPF